MLQREHKRLEIQGTCFSRHSEDVLFLDFSVGYLGVVYLHRCLDFMVAFQYLVIVQLKSKKEMIKPHFPMEIYLHCPTEVDVRTGFVL